MSLSEDSTSAGTKGRCQHGDDGSTATSFFRLFSRFRNSVRRRGLRRTFATVTRDYLFSYKSSYVFYRTLSTDGKIVRAFTYRRATVDDLDVLSVFRSKYGRSEFRYFIEQGDFVFLAFDGERPIAFQIYSRRLRTRLPYCNFPLGKERVWVVEIYTLPEYRQQHVASSLRTYRAQYLLACGYTESVGVIAEDNLPSLADGWNAEIYSVQFFVFMRFLWFTRFVLVPDARAKLARYLRDHGIPSKQNPITAKQKTPAVSG